VESLLIPTWKVAEAKMSIRVNGAYIRFTAAPDTMQRFVRPALFATGRDDYELRKVGTALMAKYRGWSFGLITSHQTNTEADAPRADAFVVLLKDGEGQLAIPPTAYHRPKFSEKHSANDVLTVFDYSAAASRRRIDHLELENVLWSNDDQLDVEYSFLVGYPTTSVDYQFETDQETLAAVAIKWVRQDLQRAERMLLDPELRDIFIKPEASSRLSIDPDGLSGSPVFLLCLTRIGIAI
jgi:hypothetical protein